MEKLVGIVSDTSNCTRKSISALWKVKVSREIEGGKSEKVKDQEQKEQEKKKKNNELLLQKISR